MSDFRLAPATRLDQVRYDIRGPLSQRARELEQQGVDLLRINIGNPARFDLHPPAALREAIAAHLHEADAYGHELGLETARAALVADAAARGIHGLDADHVFIGNGVSELIDMALRALLEPGDEVLLPCPDYPLWSAATRLNGGVPRYYDCPASRGHLPDAGEIEAMITPRTRALVLINPNNPTGAVYPRALLQQLVALAARHGLLLLSDEIYDGITYDDAQFTPLAALAGDVPCLSFGGLSKLWRACGYRVGWLQLTGAHAALQPLRDALQLLAALRLCANQMGQWAIPAALRLRDEIQTLTTPGGRLHATRAALIEGIARSEFLDVVAPRGAIYAFPALRDGLLPGFDDQAFALDLLEHEHVLLTPGSGFNLANSRHLRLTLLPEPAIMAEVLARLERALARHAQAAAPRYAHG
ncbi:MAG: aminotransferase class I/II-fold pyridoxal phosphate-dependent enzyme [Metallibacterium scheffleri]|jgi:alanine-synthesizing transaminase|uniref:aminotransferase class I/II-fold pyridoxal phosphate-dependent enzyme n=1 Tax=Metallibacterium scheffleri TaxID=993689 RepID=UPI0026EA0E06|nr:aminotransferase class I/II-fold pyridoxal phosphate-dependent enzyme [Metallibacterium scheffleri]MCK9368267.1 aminotransferase class I/II-fold pyridoxal phosphate-dependent enzyme [Metallibacterium scheffleri]